MNLFKISRTALPYVLSACLGATLVLTECGPPRPKKIPPHKRFDRLIDHLTEDLQLTPKQQAEVEALRRGMHDRRRKLKDRRHRHMEKMIAMVRRDSVSLDDALALDREMAMYHDQQKEFLIGSFVKIHALLTPEQRARLADRLEDVHRRKVREKERRRRGEPPLPPDPDGPPPMPKPPGPL